MPRSAATILGLTLVALSIGFNTARYPVVWEMVNPARASESVQPATTSQPENPENPTPAAPPSQPAKPIEVQPMPGGAGTTAADGAALARQEPVSGNMAAADLDARQVLVPVLPVGSSPSRDNGAVGGAGIRRLPPVVAGNSDWASRDAGRPRDGSIPVYPSTGIE